MRVWSSNYIFQVFKVYILFFAFWDNICIWAQTRSFFKNTFYHDFIGFILETVIFWTFFDAVDSFFVQQKNVNYLFIFMCVFLYQKEAKLILNQFSKPENYCSHISDRPLVEFHFECSSYWCTIYFFIAMTWCWSELAGLELIFIHWLQNQTMFLTRLTLDTNAYHDLL